jgi:hypothetical protein
LRARWRAVSLAPGLAFSFTAQSLRRAEQMCLKASEQNLAKSGMRIEHKR